MQRCIAKNEGGYTQRGVAKGLKVPCLFMITEVSIRCQKNPEVGIRRIPAYTPQYTTGHVLIDRRRACVCADGQVRCTPSRGVNTKIQLCVVYNLLEVDHK